MKLTLDSPSSAIPIPLSAADTVPFTPERYAGKEGAPVYLLRVPTFRTRAALERASLPIQMRIPSDALLNETAIAAAKTLVKADQLDACLEVLGNYAAFLENPERLKDNPDGAQALAEEARSLHSQLMPYSAALAEMLAERVACIGMLRYLAARYFLAGWENVSVRGEVQSFKTGADGLVAENIIQILPPEDINAIAGFAQKLMQPDEALAKN